MIECDTEIMFQNEAMILEAVLFREPSIDVLAPITLQVPCDYDESKRFHSSYNNFTYFCLRF